VNYRTVGAVLAMAALLFLLSFPRDYLDLYLADSRLFPRPVVGVGLTSVATAAVVGASVSFWRGGRWRALLALGLAGGLAVGFTWGFRYLLWITFGVNGVAGVSPQVVTLVQWTGSCIAGSLGLGLASLRVDKPHHLLIHVATVLVAVLLSDGLVQHLGIDGRMMSQALYYQTVEIEVHEPLDDPELLYGLKPGSRLGGVGPWGIREVIVNRWGARARDYPQARTEGVRRVLVFGGSTLYGAGVDNRDTTPAQLERLLNRSHPTEVWNFGVCAYNTAQAARLASLKLAELKPDLIVLMITNTGRRAFMGGPTHQDADNRPYFEANPSLYLENFPPTALSEEMHLGLLEYSGLFRAWSAWQRVYTDPDTTYADRSDRRLVAALERAAAASGTPVLYVLAPSRGSEIGPLDLGVSADRWLDLAESGREGDYTQAHPSPAILGEYAQRMVPMVTAALGSQ
jgi:hypothetical protein